MIDPARLVAAHPELGEARRLWVAYSGGLDSTVLLHLVRAAFPDVPLCAIHVNHRLSPFADQWQRHCAARCLAWNIALVTEVVGLGAGGVEAAARQARYEAFERHLGNGEVLLQAHHADDQAETVLFRLMRSAGPRGLAGVPASRPFGRGRIVRPLLDCRRADLLDYARRDRLDWIEDESNRDERFDRNFLRLRVLPVLEQRWPHAVGAIGTSAGRLRDMALLLDEWAQEQLVEVDERVERLGWSINLTGAAQRSDRRWHHLLRSWALGHGLPEPGAAVLDQFRGTVLGARADANPRLHWPGGSLARFRGRLYLLPALPGEQRAHVAEAVPPTSVPWDDFPEPLELADGFRLEATPDPDGPLWLPEDCRPAVGFRRGGERCRLPGRAHRHELKALLRDWPLEPWLRAQVPLLYCGEELAAVGDLWVCAGFSSNASDAASIHRGWRLRWYRGAGIG